MAGLSLGALRKLRKQRPVLAGNADPRCAGARVTGGAGRSLRPQTAIHRPDGAGGPCQPPPACAAQEDLMKQLTVHYCGWGEDWPLGRLADDGQTLLFEYSPEALSQGLELSPLHLKLRADAYGGIDACRWRLES